MGRDGVCVCGGDSVASRSPIWRREGTMRRKGLDGCDVSSHIIHALHTALFLLCDLEAHREGAPGFRNRWVRWKVCLSFVFH